MNEDIFRKALLTVQARRQQAHVENERRQEEVSREIPQIAEINSQLAQTASRLLVLAQSGRMITEELKKLEHENKEAQQLSADLLIKHGYPADYLDIHYHCPKCQDTGYAQDRYCTCLQAELAAASIQKMNQQAHLTLCTFEQFSLDHYRNIIGPNGEDCYSVMQQILQYCQKYARNFRPDSTSLLLYGRTGVGKTHLSLAIASEVIKKGYNVIYDSVINLLGNIEQEHFGRAKENADTLSLLLECDLLILDDLGTEFDTTFNASCVYNIINTRLNKGLPTIISTNLDYIGIRAQYDERIVSRLYALYTSLQLMGADVRLLKKKQNEI